MINFSLGHFWSFIKFKKKLKLNRAFFDKMQIDKITLENINDEWKGDGCELGKYFRALRLFLCCVYKTEKVSSKIASFKAIAQNFITQKINHQ